MLREGLDEGLAWHAGGLNGQAHDDTLLGADPLDGGAQGLGEFLEDIGDQLELEKDLGDLFHGLAGAVVHASVLLQARLEVEVTIAHQLDAAGDLLGVRTRIHGGDLFRFLFVMLVGGLVGLLLGMDFFHGRRGDDDHDRGGDMLLGVREAGDGVGQPHIIPGDAVKDFQEALDAARVHGEGGEDLIQAFLDALGNLEFAFAGQ